MRKNPKYSKSVLEEWAAFTPPTQTLIKLVATVIATIVAAVVAAEAGKKDNPNNPFAAIVVTAKQRITTSTAIVAAIIAVAEEE